jgi:CheY-like chemotaxis protein
VKILFIEDEETASLGLKAILQDHGHIVDIAETADQAAGQLQSNRYDLLLLDIMIDPSGILAGTPRREVGKELLLRIRAKQIVPLLTSPEVPVIAITAAADLGIYTALQRAGVKKILQKPIDPEDAYNEIKEILAALNPTP